MKIIDSDTPANYMQPIRQYLSRDVANQIENVDYVPEANMRIWYNNQVEGYPLHKHPAIEIVIPVENGYKYIANGINFQLDMGDILFIPPNTLHEIECDAEGARFIYLFDIDFIRNLFDFKDLEEFFSEPRLVNPNTAPNIYSHIYEHFMEINDLYFLYGNKVCELSIYSHLLAILGTLAMEASKAEAVTLINNKERENYIKFKSLINYINTHYMDNLTLEYAANFVGFSKFHFSRLFKEYTDSTFYDYLLQRRIQAAMVMLDDDSISIMSVAIKCGFNNQTTFCRCFTNVAGCSPSQYRTKLKKGKKSNS